MRSIERDAPSARGARRLAWVLSASLAACSASAHGEPAPRRDPMPEPVLGESITDIDSDVRGEGDVELTGTALAPRRDPTEGGGAVEVELKVTHRLALAVEGTYTGAAGLGLETANLRIGGSIGVVHDWARDFHLQLEVTGRPASWQFVPGPVSTDPLGGSLFMIGLRGGVRRGRVTARFGFGASLSDRRHIPVWADGALLVEWGPSGRMSFAGVEVTSNWSVDAPVAVAAELGIGVTREPLPIRVGLAAPLVVIGAPVGRTSVGALVRVIFELGGAQ